MPTRYEYYNAGDNYYDSIRAAYWFAQTFTPATAHKITSVKLKLYRLGSPGTVTVSIKATDGSGHPTGADLCSGTTNGNTLTDTSPGEWREITLGAGYNLDADTKYAIVVRALNGDSSNYVAWRSDGTSPTYAGGCLEYSEDSGSSWGSDTGYDFMFEDWGEPLGVTHELTLTDGIQLTDTLVKNPIKTLSDSFAIGEALVKNPIKTLTDGIALTDTWEGYKLVAKVLTDGIAFTDALVKSTSKTITDGIAFTDTAYRTFIKTFTDGIAIGEALRKDIAKTLTDGIAFTDTVFRTFIRTFTDGIKFTDFLLKWRWLTPVRKLLPKRLLQPKREEPLP